MTPADEQEWLDEQEEFVFRYLDRRARSYTKPLEIEWCLAPYVAVWTTTPPGVSTKYWIICGDLPTDLLEDSKIKTPRTAISTFAGRWIDVAKFMLQGKSHPTIQIGPPQVPRELEELGKLLQNRAILLQKWSADSTNW